MVMMERTTGYLSSFGRQDSLQCLKSGSAHALTYLILEVSLHKVESFKWCRRGPRASFEASPRLAAP